jgi:hypothetical protein
VRGLVAVHVIAVADGHLASGGDAVEPAVLVEVVEYRALPGGAVPQADAASLHDAQQPRAFTIAGSPVSSVRFSSISSPIDPCPGSN